METFSSANASTSITSPPPNATLTPLLPIRTLSLTSPSFSPSSSSSTGPRVALARTGQSFALIRVDLEEDECEAPIWAQLNVLVHEDPFPGYSGEGNEMIWIKTYSENAGLLEQLVAAGWVRVSGRTIKQGYVTLPLVELRLAESEMAQQCPACERFELPGGEERFKRCGKCKKRYYCQLEDWKDHKIDCRDLAAGRLAQVENRKRKQTEDYMSGLGFQSA